MWLPLPSPVPRRGSSLNETYRNENSSRILRKDAMNRLTKVINDFFIT
jgi:hypothetical protein